MAAGQLRRDPSLNLPPPPVEELPPEQVAPVEQTKPATAIQIQISVPAVANGTVWVTVRAS